jgi:hypothetical protein
MWGTNIFFQWDSENVELRAYFVECHFPYGLICRCGALMWEFVNARMTRKVQEHLQLDCFAVGWNNIRNMDDLFVHSHNIERYDIINSKNPYSAKIWTSEIYHPI